MSKYVCVLGHGQCPSMCVFETMVSVQVCVCFRPWSVSKYVCVLDHGQCPSRCVF